MKRWRELTIALLVFLSPLAQSILPPLYAGQCVVQVRMINHNRYVYKTDQECGLFHSTPWGNWGVSSNVGVKQDANQFQGWFPQDGHLQWNSCSTGYVHPDLDCRVLNFPNSPLPGTSYPYPANGYPFSDSYPWNDRVPPSGSDKCVDQYSPYGHNTYGETKMSFTVPDPTDSNGDGILDSGGCLSLNGQPLTILNNYMTVYEIDVPDPDDLVQTLYYPDVSVNLNCTVGACLAVGDNNYDGWLDDIDNPASPAYRWPNRYQDPGGLLSLATDPGVPAKRIDATIRIGYALGSYNGVGLDGLTLFVPIVLSSAGLNNSFFTSELVLTNRGFTNANVQFTYTAALGSGSGTASTSLPAGQQRIVPDAIAYLKSIGIPIPDSGNRGGTLAVRFSSPEGAVTVRTTAALASGRAGLAYAGIPITTALTGASYLCGLRQNVSDRSNVAIQNAGTAADGDVALRLTVFSGDPAAPFSQMLPNESLSPGSFRQITEILHSNGLSLTNGYVRIERVSGTAPYFAYAVINDQVTSDGSFIPPIPENALAGKTGLTLPVIVETGSFTSELVLTNWSTTSKTIRFAYVAEAIQAAGNTASFGMNLNPGQQLIVPNLVQFMRDRRVAGIGPVGPTYAGALFATVDAGDLTGIGLGARTSIPGGGGNYGVFYAPVPNGTSPKTSAWLYGLQQNAENRTNLALVNAGETDGNPDLFTIELFDGDTGNKVTVLEGIAINAKAWKQLGGILTDYAPGTRQGYARVTRTAGTNPFIAYAVINDGSRPGERTGDGAYVPSLP
ncbi:MAG: hypothetical protein L0387_05740 [Acidobacteria bacterium]|nr:hypothetical protein [Acidobacteriota bacterium]MCI0722951.1 hypothetical protein [Acidobacteriota bacterium]